MTPQAQKLSTMGTRVKAPGNTKLVETTFAYRSEFGGNDFGPETSCTRTSTTIILLYPNSSDTVLFPAALGL